MGRAQRNPSHQRVSSHSDHALARTSTASACAYGVLACNGFGLAEPSLSPNNDLRYTLRNVPRRLRFLAAHRVEPGYLIQYTMHEDRPMISLRPRVEGLHGRAAQQSLR